MWPDLPGSIGGILKYAKQYVANKAKQAVVNIGKAVVHEAKKTLSKIESSLYLKGELKGTVGPRIAANSKGLGGDVAYKSKDLFCIGGEIDKKGVKPDIFYKDQTGQFKETSGIKAGGPVLEGVFAEGSAKTETVYNGSLSDSKNTIASETTEATGTLTPFPGLGLSLVGEKATTGNSNEYIVRSEVGVGWSGAFIFGIDFNLSIGYKASLSTGQKDEE